MGVAFHCPVCSLVLSEYGTGGMTCPEGHHFMASDVRGKRPSVRHVGKRAVTVRPWIPGAVLGGLALLIELAGAVI